MTLQYLFIYTQILSHPPSNRIDHQLGGPSSAPRLQYIVFEVLHLTLSMHVCMHERVCVDMRHVHFSKHHCTLCCRAFGVVSDQQPEMASTAASAAEPFLDASLLQCAETPMTFSVQTR